MTKTAAWYRSNPRVNVRASSTARPKDAFPPMKKALLLAAAIAATLAACNQSPAPGPSQGTSDAAASGAPDTGPADAAPAEDAKARVARIEASGKTGLWAEPAGVCAQGSKDGVLVAWNVRDTGATQVEVTLVTKEGDERTFGKGGPVGAKESGRWVRPGRVFKIRDAADGQELGSLTIADAGC